MHETFSGMSFDQHIVGPLYEINLESIRRLMQLTLYSPPVVNPTLKP